ncbi:Apple-like protein [Cynara cardunculus var. scolymus]|uniref:Receptor-like serine/threonine-protein kinase n=1 Tax=Cynara cardunculus var. scolymus TaxID=59895 RepID=A0A103Y1Z5_CYNCS|nr:Apple-like protein [Cynara cardunculus var. scolymus]
MNFCKLFLIWEMGFTHKALTTLHLVSFILLLHFLPVFPQIISRIDEGQSIRDGETLVSAGRVFELGFFSPENSSLRYVGIWYYRIQNQSRTVVWVANRNAPISGDSGVFNIGINGSLIISDGSGDVYWSSSNSVVTSNLTVMLMDTGNLALSTVENAGDDSNAIWRSCDNPTDTYLPNLRVYLNISRGDSHRFVSWKNPNDPANGNYSMGVDPRGSPQVVVWNDQSRRRLWRSGHWNYQIFVGIPQMRSLLLFGFRLVPVDNDLMYFIFNNPNTTVYMRFLIQWNGLVQQLTWNDETSQWSVMLSQPSTGCEEYNKCGNFGICRTISVPNICTCMEGFDPNPDSRDQWNRGNWSGGCVRRTPLECNSNGTSNDGFWQRTGVKLPDFADRLVVGSSGDCEDGCLSNCSCNAYAYVSGVGCLIWGGDLVDVEQFEEGGETLFIRLADSDLGSTKKVSRTVAIAVPVTGVVVLGIIVWLLWRYRQRLKECRNPCGKATNPPPVFEASNGQETSVETSGPPDYEGKAYEGPSLPLYSSRQEIAVKRLSKSSGQGLGEFKNEMILIAKLQHRNLVRLLGRRKNANPKRKAELDWKTRFKIIEGIARGLLYLHRDSRLRIIHRDLKVSNILLDEEMNPKISDFGMARIFGGNQNEANTNRVYAMEGLFSVKSDVYSFGVLLLEIISGQRNNSFRSADSTNLIRHAWKLWKEGKGEELIDPLILDSCNKNEALQCIHVAMLCVQSSAIQRPTMSSVVFMLEGENTSLPQPNEMDMTSLSSVEMDLIMEGREINISSNDWAGGNDRKRKRVLCFLMYQYQRNRISDVFRFLVFLKAVSHGALGRVSNR